jgi:hypothetical protein
MADGVQRSGNGAREQIHLPGNTLLPLYTGLAVALTLLGLILSWPFVAVGGALTALCVYFWVKTAAADYERLPRER